MFHINAGSIVFKYSIQNRKHVGATETANK